MSHDEAYLGASLNDRTYDAAKACELRLNAVMSENAAAGRLASGATLIAFGNVAERIFGEEFDKAATFVFNLTGGNTPEAIGPLDYFAGRVVDLVVDKLKVCGQHTGIAEATVAREINKISVQLGEMRTRRVRDFSHGMMGNERMKKDPVVSVINTQSNSPGAIQQVGIDQFSQAAFVRHHDQLISAVENALASPEFQRLEQSQKEGFRDVADTLKDEATKANPDPGKLKRWSERFMAMAKEVGLRVAVSEVGQAITHIFGSAG